MGNEDGTTLTYSRDVGAPESLQAGEVVEFTTDLAFEVQGTGSIAVASYLPGSTQQGSSTCPMLPCWGDPAFAILTPVEQLSREYVVAPNPHFQRVYAQITAPAGASVNHADEEVALEPLDQDWQGAVIELTDTAVLHRFRANEPFALQLIGYDESTSYYLSADGRFAPISPPVIIPPR